MPRKTKLIDPLRLCEAADVAIHAIVEAQESDAPTHYPPDLLDTPYQPDCLSGFTRREIEEACRFLIRLGLIRVRTDDPE